MFNNSGVLSNTESTEGTEIIHTERAFGIKTQKKIPWSPCLRVEQGAGWGRLNAKQKMNSSRIRKFRVLAVNKIK
jgi:hypothetical protein